MGPSYKELSRQPCYERLDGRERVGLKGMRKFVRCRRRLKNLPEETNHPVRWALRRSAYVALEIVW